MLFNVLLKAGEFVTLTRQGRFVNIVLAAGEIQGRFTMNGGKPLQTNLISGMAFEPGLFSEASFKSPVTQQAKIWIGETPLNYTPEISRAVGSNAIHSFVGKVFSGVATELLPAQAGRNKITISPVDDLLLGGSNLNAVNGILVRKGETFSLNTQGQVMALDVSGNYPYTVRSTVGDKDISSAEHKIGNDSPVNLRQGMFHVRPGEVWGRSGNAESDIAVRSREDFTQLRSISVGSVKAAHDLFINGRYCTVTYDGSGVLEWVEITDDYQVTRQDLNFNGAGTGRVVAASTPDGKVRAVVDGGKRQLSVSVNGGEFVAGVSDWNPVDKDIPTGLAVTPDGVVFVKGTKNGIYRTVDGGDSWEWLSTDLPYSSVYVSRGLYYDVGKALLYCLFSGGLWVSSDKGETFSKVSGVHKSANMIVGSGSTLFVWEWSQLWVINDETGVTYYELPQIDSSTVYDMSVNPDGVIYCAFKMNEHLIVRGDVEPYGGLSVPIMAEVN